jgi:photosystem II stability/assembly factor-like uncharacterized protein
MALIKNKIFIARILLSGLCLLFLATTFHTENRSSGWYFQSITNINGSAITNLIFLDSLTGYTATRTSSTNQCYILKTTNSGNNWNVIYTYNSGSNIRFTKIQFADDSIGYASTDYYDFFKTTNAGLNWIQLSTLDGAEDMAVINKDTILVVSSDGFAGGVFRTTNGGLSWQALGQTGGTGQPNRIYMYNKDIGFSDDNSVGSRFKKTTNGGLNWIQLSSGESFRDIKFTDSLEGWKCSGADIKKTTDGGFTWRLQQLPSIFNNSFNQLSIPNTNKLWGVGGSVLINNKVYGVMYKSTNEGINWGYQLADTSVHIPVYYSINFSDNRTGWSYAVSTGVHTTTGGNDTTFFTGIKLVENFIPSGYTLGQNYPNPFNPSTNIPFELSESGYIVLKVYDITGRTIKELVNGRWGKGRYIVDFDGTSLPSGIYFYRIEITGDITKTPFTETKKMLLIK